MLAHLLGTPRNPLMHTSTGARLARTEGHVARSKHLPKTLTRDETARLLAQPSRRYPTGIRNRALLRTFYRAGLRSAEALELRVRDVNLARNEQLRRRLLDRAG